jgi:hypothetical protein
MGGYQINTTTALSALPFFFFLNKKAILSVQNDSKRGLATWIINTQVSDWIHMAPESTCGRNL